MDHGSRGAASAGVGELVRARDALLAHIGSRSTGQPGQVRFHSRRLPLRRVLAALRQRCRPPDSSSDGRAHLGGMSAGRIPESPSPW